jgi:hypothetical protein
MHVNKIFILDDSFGTKFNISRWAAYTRIILAVAVSMHPKADFGASSFVWTAQRSSPDLINCVGGIEGSRRNSIELVALGSKLSFRVVLYPNPNEWHVAVGMETNPSF